MHCTRTHISRLSSSTLKYSWWKDAIYCNRIWYYKTSLLTDRVCKSGCAFQLDMKRYTKRENKLCVIHRYIGSQQWNIRFIEFHTFIVRIRLTLSYTEQRYYYNLGFWSWFCHVTRYVVELFFFIYRWSNESLSALLSMKIKRIRRNETLIFDWNRSCLNKGIHELVQYLF